MSNHPIYHCLTNLAPFCSYICIGASFPQIKSKSLSLIFKTFYLLAKPTILANYDVHKLLWFCFYSSLYLECFNHSFSPLSFHFICSKDAYLPISRLIPRLHEPAPFSRLGQISCKIENQEFFALSYFWSISLQLCRTVM